MWSKLFEYKYLLRYWTYQTRNVRYSYHDVHKLEKTKWNTHTPDLLSHLEISLLSRRRLPILDTQLAFTTFKHTLKHWMNIAKTLFLVRLDVDINDLGIDWTVSEPSAVLSWNSLLPSYF